MTVGQTLAAARAESGLSVEQVSERTRIRATIIADMERDDFSRCGGEFYARAHLRDIARVIGADADAMVAQYDAEHGAPPAPTAAEVFEPERRSYVAHRGVNWSAVMAVAIVAVLAFGVFRVWSDSGNDTGGTPVAGETRTPSATTSAPSTPTPSATETPTYIAQAPRGVTVVLDAANGSCWASISNAAGKVLFEGTLRKGEQRTVTDKTQVRMVLGNAGAVNLTVNGRNIGAPGGVGKVVRLSFAPDDPAAG